MQTTGKNGKVWMFYRNRKFFDMPQDNEKTNFDGLLEHLPEDSLATKLVRAYVAGNRALPADALRSVLNDRLQELKEIYAERED